ncbi:uncharacterized protein LOC143246712 isoform X2 [Tachypleus tridentatus]|uniref:uncharacterized protein LOC143246712 isoform X2 n=1 Tax=Tachypleus tridentatus TaxID=6853 RepID=UPI003FD12DB2
MKRFQKTILTVPRVLSDFTVTNCYLLQPCLKCGAVDQRKHLQFESLSECIAVHFVDGLLTNSVSSYDFAHHNVQYKVKGVIQYKTNCSPKHFVTWIRNPTENTWLCCDDLQGSKVAFQQEDPQILASQMHVLVWEKEQSDTVVPGYLDQDKTLTQSSSCGSSVHLLQNAVSHPSLVQVPGSALPKETPFVSRSIGPDSTLTSAELQEGIESLAVCSKIQTTLVTSEKHSTLAPSMTDSCSECLKPPHLADLKDENITPVIEYNKLSCNPVFVTTTSVNMTSFVNSQVTSESNCQPAVMITSIVNSTFLTPSVQPTVMTTSSVNATLLTSGVQPTVMTTSSVNSTLLTSGVQPTVMTTSSVNATLLTSGVQPTVMTTSSVNATLLTSGVQPTVMTTSSVNSTLLTSGVQPTVMTTSSVNSTLLTSGVQPTVMTTSSVNSTLLTSGVQPTVMTKYMNSRIRPSDVQSEVITRMTANPTLLVTGIQPTVMTPTMSSTPLTQSTVNHILLTSGVQSSVITKSNQNPSILVSGVQPTVVTQSAVNPKLLKSGVYPTVMTQSAANCILVTTGVHPSIMTSAVRPTLVTSGVQPIVMTTSMNPTLLTSGGESKVMTQSTVNPTLLLSGVQPLIITSTVSPTLLPSGVQPTVITTSVNCTTAVSNVQSMTIPTSTLNPTVMNTASAESTCMTSCVTHMAMSELSSLVPVGRDAENYATDFTHDLAVSSTDNGRKQTAIYIMTRDDDKEPKLHLLTTVPADTSSAKALLESTGIVSSSESVSPQYSSDVNYGRISQELEACHADRFVSTRSQSFLQNRLLKRKKTAKRMVNTRPAQKRNSHNTEYFNNPKISLEFDENVVPLGDNIKPCKTKKLQKVSEGSQKKVKQLEQLEVTRKENILAAQSVPSSVAEYVGLSGSIPSPSDRSIASEGEASLLSSSGIFDCGSTDVSSSESGSKKTSLSKQFFVKQIKTLVKEKCRSSGYEGYKPKLTPVRTNPTSRKRKMNSTASFNEEPDEVSPKFLKSTEIAQDEGSYLVNKINQKSVWSDNIITELFG